MCYNNVVRNFKPQKLIPIVQKYNALFILDFDFELFKSSRLNNTMIHRQMNPKYTKV